MDTHKAELLERIAVALEKIAEKLDENSSLIAANQQKYAPIIVQTSEIIATTDVKTEQPVSYINDVNPIYRFLSELNIQVKALQHEDENDGVLDTIALFMGSRYDSIKPVYDKIKSNLNTGRGFRLDLKNVTQVNVGNLCQLCTSLHQIAFLSEYKYLKSPQFLLTGKPNRIPTAINFFTGQWLERFIKTQVIKSINQLNRPFKFAYLNNPQIILPNGDDFELDIIFSIEEEFFWFETKTGDYQNYVEKYSKVAKIMKLNKEHCFMILSEVSDTNATALKTLFGMTVTNLGRFSEVFNASIAHFNNVEG